MVYYNFFKSYSDAVAKVGENCTVKAYSNQRWLKRLAEFNDHILESNTVGYKKRLPRSSSLPLFLSANQEIQSIIDIGGGGGWLGIYIKRHFKQISVYNIIELDFIRNYFNKSISTYGVNYIDEEYASNHDLLYSNSCIQYMADLKTFYSTALRTQPKYILLDDLYISQKEQFYCHQRYYEETMVMCFLDYSNLCSSLSEIGYSLSFTDIYQDPILGQNNYIPCDESIGKEWVPENRYSFLFN